jgi:hypothetical protein
MNLSTLQCNRSTLTLPVPQANLVEWLKRMVAERRVVEVLDPKLPEDPPSKALKRVVLAALRCVDPDAGQRPTMSHVVHMLEDQQIPRDVRVPFFFCSIFRFEHRFEIPLLHVDGILG